MKSLDILVIILCSILVLTACDADVLNVQPQDEVPPEDVWSDPNVNHSTSEKQEIPWRFFRYGEILLNYAEASIELGDYEDARNALNQIRDRAGMPDITESGDELRQRYRNERRVEMAFEDQRYFDIRRWMIAPEVMTNARGIEIYAEAEDPRDRSTYSNYEYSVINVQNRGWNDRSYFTPILTEEIQRNENLIQNPGY